MIKKYRRVICREEIGAGLIKRESTRGEKYEAIPFQDLLPGCRGDIIATIQPKRNNNERRFSPDILPSFKPVVCVNQAKDFNYKKQAAKNKKGVCKSMVKKLLLFDLVFDQPGQWNECDADAADRAEGKHNAAQKKNI